MNQVETTVSYDMTTDRTNITSSVSMREILNSKECVSAVLAEVNTNLASKIADEIYQEVLKRVDVQAIVNQSLPEISKLIVERMAKK